MKYLWDTHTFLWWVSGSSSLSAKARQLIEADGHEAYLSVASLWEISIKTSLERLEITGSYETVIDDVRNNGIQLLPITFPHTLQQHQLPFHHRDPFDRMIISQAIVEGMPIISADRAFKPYPIECIW